MMKRMVRMVMKKRWTVDGVLVRTCEWRDKAAASGRSGGRLHQHGSATDVLLVAVLGRHCGQRLEPMALQRTSQQFIQPT